MEFLNFLVLFLVIILGLMIAMWLLSLWLKNSSIVDIFWGTGFVIVAWMAFFLSPVGLMSRNYLLNILVTLWGLRLSIHILIRNWGKPEDYRYRAWRNQAGTAWWWRSFFKVFLMQGVILWIVAVPLIYSEFYGVKTQSNFLVWLAIPVWLLGFIFEALGDYQLSAFKYNPANKGKLLDFGVWRFTCHPNYFGDSAQWWSYYLISLAAGGWWTIFSPIIMTTLLMRVSGVALLEKSLKKEKPGYLEYIQRTSEFFPWFPRQK